MAALDRSRIRADASAQAAAMKRTSYLKRARRRFLEGTRCKSPLEAVEAGLRTLCQWADVLAEEREAENHHLLQRRNLERSATLGGRRVRARSAR